jgi:outer membrane receptor protein involved in Fe transport
MIESAPPNEANVVSGQSSTLPRVLLFASFASALATASLAAADLDRTVNFNIPAQSLEGALLEFSRQAHVPVSINAQALQRINAPPVSGRLPVSAALSELLVHSGLEYGTIGNTVTVSPRAAGSSDALPPAQAKASTSSELRLAQSNTSPGVVGGARTTDSDARPPQEEVLVTAQKRSERLEDVPVPVTAIGADALLDRNQLRLQDYFATVPGLSYLPGVRGESLLVIRGVTTDPYTNPTVSITVDDIPYGSSTVNGGGNSPPDIDPSDLSRVEVLRGPQGTLYGASSIGGLLKFVTVDPSTDAVSGRVQGSGSAVHNGEGAGYSVRGSVNLPLGDDLAARASAFTRRDPGYVDNIQSGQDGVNRVNAYGGRLSGLWRPTQDLSLKLGAYLQDSQAHGSPDIDPRAGLGDLQQRRLRDTGTYERKSEVFSANLTDRLGPVSVTSLTGYTIDKLNALRDYSIAPFVGLATRAYGVTAAELLDERRTTKFSEEVRLSGNITERFEWLVGGFYTDERAPFVESLAAADLATAVPVGNILTISFPSTYKEYAGFADLTYHFTDQFDIQVGGRESHDKQTLDQTQTLLGKTTAVSGHTSENAFTYLVTPRFRISRDLMVYARLASGFRPGGINAIGGTPTVPLTYGPDKTQNYEIGAKGDVLDRLLTFDASVYYIDWKDIQLSLTQNGLGFRDNAGHAKSQGVELSVESRPVRGMVIASWIAWNDAELTESLPTTSTVAGLDGDRLPNSSRFSANFSFDQDFPLTASMTGFVGGSVSYVGNRVGVFTSTAALRQYFPAYAKTDLRMGMRYDSWSGNVFVTNVTDRRGVFTGNLLGTQPFIDYIQPRTVGLSVSKSF